MFPRKGLAKHGAYSGQLLPTGWDILSDQEAQEGRLIILNVARGSYGQRVSFLEPERAEVESFSLGATTGRSHVRAPGLRDRSMRR